MRVTLGNIGAIVLSSIVTLILLYPLVMQTITVGTYIALVKAIYHFIESISWQFVMLIKNFISNKLYFIWIGHITLLILKLLNKVSAGYWTTNMAYQISASLSTATLMEPLQRINLKGVNRSL